MGRPSGSSRGRSASRHSAHASFLGFVTNVLTKAEVKVPVLLVALVYIDRAKPHLQIALEQWACERVFLGALIIANKVSPRRFFFDVRRADQETDDRFLLFAVLQ